MRIYKFRAWHEEDQVMIYDLNTPSLFHGVLLKDDYILMQFTGIYDKNGKEIYENDVVIVTTHGKRIGIVNFSMEEIVCFKVGEGYLVKWYDIEVIGNIYENPELLGSISS